MTLQNLIAFNLVLWAAILSPGPAFLTAIHTTLKGGRRAGIAIACGLGLVAAGWTMSAWRGARNPVAAHEEVRAGHAFIRGLLVNLLNPKSVMSSRLMSSPYLRAKPALDRAAAVVLGALGLRLFISR